MLKIVPIVNKYERIKFFSQIFGVSLIILSILLGFVIHRYFTIISIFALIIFLGLIPWYINRLLITPDTESDYELDKFHKKYLAKLKEETENESENDKD